MTDKFIGMSRQERKRFGHIYFVACDPMDAVKIGFTRGDPATRYKGLQTSCPAPLRLAAHFPGTLDDERRLHAAFQFMHIHGEWFRHRGKLRELVEWLADGGDFADAVHDVLYQGYVHPDEPPECQAIYQATGDWRPFEHLLEGIGQ